MSQVDKQKRSKTLSLSKGFTLVELTLAMGFVSMLLIAITMTVIQIGNIYNRGITMKEVNQIGQSVTDELQRTISQTSRFDIPPIANNKYIIFQENIGGTMTNIGGRLCTGHYSFVWNNAVGLAQSPVPAGINIYSAAGADVIYFVKVNDPDGNLCVLTIPADPTSYPNIIKSEAIELINTGDRNIVLHSFDISIATQTIGGAEVPIAYDSKTEQQLYNISFVLGTNKITAIDTANNTCRAPGTAGSDLEYCAINKFNITIRVGNQA